MTVTAPPRSPRPSDPVDREEIEALVEALIEEARQRAQRRRRRNAAVMALVTLVGVAVFAIVGRTAESDSASPALAARSSPAGPPVALRLAFTGYTRDVVNRNVPNPPPPTPRTSELYFVNADGSDKRLLARRRHQGALYERAAWSPDGQTIAIRGAAGVLFVNADGTGLRNVDPRVGARRFACLVAQWSQDRVRELARRMWARERSWRDLSHERGRTRASQVDTQRARRRSADVVAERHTDRLLTLQRSPSMRRMGR